MFNNYMYIITKHNKNTESCGHYNTHQALNQRFDQGKAREREKVKAKTNRD